LLIFIYLFIYLFILLANFYLFIYLFIFAVLHLVHAVEKVPTIEELEALYVIKDWPLFVASAVLIGLVVLSFFAHSLIHLELR
jgi:Na+/H+ antiporter NhaD/arsenite permease-like protein